MTDLRTAAQQALAFTMRDFATVRDFEAARARLHDTLRAALAEPVQEPAFHGFISADGTQVDLCFTPSAPRSDGTYATAYYTAPPQLPVEPQEPVAWYLPCPEGMDDSIFRDHRTVKACTGNKWEGFVPLYTAPPQRKPLDDLAIADIYTKWDATPGVSMADFARAIEAAHGIKE